VVKHIATYATSGGQSSSSSGANACAQSDDHNITVQTAYNADGNVSTLTEVNPDHR
jgi:hypothetical protein